MVNSKRYELAARNAVERCSFCGNAIYTNELYGEGAFGTRICVSCVKTSLEALPADRLMRILGYEPTRYIDG